MTKQRTPVVLTREEIERLFEIPEKEEKELKEELRKKRKERSPFLNYTKNRLFQAIRDQAILRLAFSTGLRSSEVCNLNDESIFLNESRIKVRFGKKGNDEYQPVTKKETLKALKYYQKARKSYRFNKGNAFFIGRNGERVKPRAIQRMVKRYANMAGIRKEVYPHLLRHTFGTEYFKVTGDIRRTQIAMRHKSISSTVIYTHIDKDDVVNGLKEADL
ncbi:Tyrosine recombinase XerC [subsurface metagenome]